jgi:hypothetical protein
LDNTVIRGLGANPKIISIRAEKLFVCSLGFLGVYIRNKGSISYGTKAF